ncbi:MAG TPA: glycoside hydrolase family 30 beta sandwich domain-containing protein [Cytophagales bacterium]|nr:glycoside hydrolase family 30 beta sandwich domain-containing protein [Cytophagales bacterium]
MFSNRKICFGLALLFCSLAFLTGGCNKKAKEEVEYVPSQSHISFWLTNIDKSALFERQDIDLAFENTTNNYPTIQVDTTETFQTIDGFGFNLTGGSAQLIMNMDPSKRKNLLNELFATNHFNIGASYLRISIGSSDLNDRVFSYNDLLPGQTDTALINFNLAFDKNDVIPLLKEILAINPDIKIMGTPWSAPIWMKTNNNSIGGSLKPEYYPTYAKYFVKYIKEMKKEGIRIDAVTIQNEPFNVKNNPSMLMMPEDQENFIKNHLGPAFEKDSIDTKIVIYDHNPNIIGYPISIMDDPEARKYIDGSAYHLYGGTIEELSKVHEAHPDKNIYFTSQWINAPGNFEKEFPYHIKTLIIGGTRNWCRVVLEWNLAADQNLRPHTEGGCTQCVGALTIDNFVTRNPAYYIIAHASKFVRPGSVRIGSNTPEVLYNVAFKTPKGNIVLIVENDAKTPQTFNVKYGGKTFTSTLNSKSVGTYVW